MRFRTLSLSGSVIAVALVLAGCTGTGGSMPGMDMGSGDTSSSTSAPSSTTAKTADEMFVTMMIPHHEQAIAMSDAILKKTGIDPKVTALAKQIKAAQSPEIQSMQAWLKAKGMSTDSAPMTGMGMMSDHDMTTLDSATGSDAARLFLSGMIAHHQGAIEMARSELSDGKDADMRALAQKVVDGQTAEITTMKDILGSL
ncbi:DUF305 domain-containing protein [Microbacterium xylanilyticum]